ncbi:MAG: alpha/beta fold hydrolase [Pseudomonadales bacterium]|nr:alpha/beta fold hydrolase [Pseudomonadales bacterium]
MNTSQSGSFIELIYQSAIDNGLFVDLYEQLAELNLPANGEAEVEQELLQHFQQSLSIAKRVNQLQQQKKVAENIINRLSTAILVLDSDARVLYSNEQAMALLKQDARIKQIDGCLQIQSKPENLELRQTLNSWKRDRTTTDKAMLLGKKSEHASVMILSPAEDAHQLLQEQLPDTACGVLFIASKTTGNAQQATRLQELYHLTPTEADITQRLCYGQSIEDIALARQSKPATIRGYIKIIFQKTSTKRQAELVTLVLNAPLHVGLTAQEHSNSGCDIMIPAKGHRQLAVRSYGPDNGTAMLLSHASMSSRFERPLDLAFLYEHKLRLLVLDRAGYGLSDGPAYEQLTDIADDILAVLAFMHIDKIKLIGTVAGGGYALAFASRYPEAVDEIILLESFSPNVMEHKIPAAPNYYKTVPRVVRAFPTLAQKIMQLSMHELSNDWEKAYDNLKRFFNDSDKQVFDADHVRSQAVKQATECSRQGIKALARDIKLIHQPWPFELKAIHNRCYVVYGNADPVATCYAQNLLKELPNSRAIFREGEGFAAMLYHNFADILCQAGWIKP